MESRMIDYKIKTDSEAMDILESIEKQVKSLHLQTVILSCEYKHDENKVLTMKLKGLMNSLNDAKYYSIQASNSIYNNQK